MTDTRQFNVAVVGAAGGIGQPLSLLMKMNPMVGRLSLYDVMGSPGVAADLGHICTGATVSGHLGDDVGAALQGCDLVIIPAGVPRKPGMTRDDLFRVNAGIVAGLARSCAEHCPEACVLVISNPVNALVPIFAAELEKAGVFDPRRLLGVTTLDLVRARTFVAEAKGVPAADVRVPVVGGHSGGTIVPLLSQCGHQFTQEEVEKLTHRIQFGGDEVVQAKAGTGSATLSMAFAGAELASSVMKGLSGETVTDYAYVQRQEGSSVPTEYFATQVTLGRGGVQATCDVHNDANEYEKELLEKAAEGLRASIQQAREFVEAAQS